MARILTYTVPCLLIWSFDLYAYWPGILTSDSFDQWNQAHHLNLLNDWHPVGHTLYEFLLTRLWDSPAMIAIFQLAILALAWGTAMSFFEGRGIRRRTLLLVTLVFALAPYNAILPVTLWKDVPYAIVNFILVFLLGRIWLSRGEWLHSRRNQVLLGLVIGLTYLFRHNGLLILILVPVGLLLFYVRKWKALLAAAAVALVLVLAVRNGLAFGLLKAQPNREATLYVVPIQHISAVVHYGGTLTPEEQAVIERLAPLKIWKNAYVKYVADTMSKPWGATKDAQVLDKIEQNKSQLLQTFFHLAIRYPKAILRSELDLTSVTWEILTPPHYRDYAMDFMLVSTDNQPITNPLFINPNPNSPVKRALDGYLLGSNSPLTYPLVWRGGLYLFLTLLFVGCMMLERGWDALLLAIPAVANVLSLALSIPGEDFRFVYPFVIPVYLIVLFAFLTRDPGKENRPNAQ